MSIYALGDRKPSFGEGSWIAHNATVIGSVTAGRNVNIWYNVVVRGDNDPITIGDDTNIQDGSVLHNDDGVPLTIGRHVTVGHMAMLHGCLLHDRAFVGLSSTVMNGCTIESDGMLAAGAILSPGKTVGARQLWMGRPAKYARDLADAALADMQAGVARYVENGRAHLAALAEAVGDGAA